MNKTLGLVLLVAIAISVFPSLNVSATGTITGRVFQDFNGNGNYDTAGSTALPAIDAGISGVVVTAYDSAGVSQGTATTVSGGTYSLSAGGTGPYRIEFTSLPSGYFPSSRSTDSALGGTATDSGSIVQFVNDGNTLNVNLAINVPSDYSQNVPSMIVPKYRNGSLAGSTTNLLSLFSNEASGTLPAATTFIQAQNIGTVWGMGYQKTNRRVFASSVLKRHSGIGPRGVDGIYAFDFNGTSLTSLGGIDLQGVVPSNGGSAIDLGSVTRTNIAGAPAAGQDNALSSDITQPSWDIDAFGKAGTVSFGDIEVSDDNSTLWAVNLNQRSLVAIDLNSVSIGVSNPNLAAPASVRQFLIRNTTVVGEPTITGAPNCTNGTLRPWALSFHRSKGYVGAVCDAATSATVQNPTEQIVYVLSFIPSNPTAFTTETSFTLGNTREPAYRGGDAINVGGTWQRWQNTWANISPANGLGFIAAAQPILSDIAFLSDGSMALGITDRFQLQSGNENYPALSGNTTTYRGINAGDIIKAGFNGSSYTVEPNNTDVNIFSGGTNQGFSIVDGPNNNGEFFGGDFFISGSILNGEGHYETSLGGLAYLPGDNEVATTVIDPQSFYAQGIRWFNHSTGGTSTRSYQLETTNFGRVGGDFGKGQGIGDIELLSDAAPIEIGNRVWNDTNGNGVQDPGETAISGITVRLFNASNVAIATAVTDAAGEYYFTPGTAVDGNLTDNIGIVNGQITPTTNYQIRLDNAVNYTGGNPLSGKFLTTINQASQLGFSEGSDSDAINVVNPTGSAAGTFPVISFTTGLSGDNNHNFDIGFAPFSVYSLGNRVWYDTNSNGQIDNAEVGISGVSVSLFTDTGCNGTPDGSALQNLLTDTSGYYRFDGLGAGCYLARIDATNFTDGGRLSGYSNTTGNVTTDADSTPTVSGENGMDPSSYFGNNALAPRATGVLSNTITLGPGTSEPTAETDVSASGTYQGQGAFDNQADMTVDFGFYEICLCGTVWLDTGAGANNNNGILDAGESVTPNVRVKLYDSLGNEIPVGGDGVLGTSDDAVGGMLTSGAGGYNFRGLPAGSYRVVVIGNPSSSSTPTNTNDDLIDNDDNGFAGAGAFAPFTVSPIVVLTPRGESGFNDADGTTANVTVDFGFITSPTAVKMDKFDVVSDGRSTVVSWETGSETNNLGFNVYREVDGRRELLTKSPIAGSALRGSADMQATGDSYQFMVKDSPKGARYFVEDLDLSGDSSFHGSMEARFDDMSKFSSASRRTMADLSVSDNDVNFETETVVSANSTKKTRSVKKPSAEALSAAKFSATRGGVKFHVDRDGWYRVSAATLVSLGFSGDAANWNLFRNGQEVPMRVSAEGSVEFYGQGVDLSTTNTQVYYLVNGDSAGKRLSVSIDSPASETQTAASFAAATERKDRTLYLSFLLNGEKENWFGPVISPTAATNQSLTVNDPTQSDLANVKVRLQGLTNTAHAVRVLLNNVEIGTVSYAGYENKVADFSVPASQLVNGANQVSLQSISANDFSVVDSVKISFQRQFKAVNNFLRFSAPADQAVKFGGFAGRFEVFEVVNGVAGEQIVPSDADTKREYIISASNRDREFVALASDQVLSPALVETNNPSDLSSKANAANFVIIAPDALKTKAEAFAAVRTSQGINTKVVSVEDIYDEFSFGSHDPKAIKDFLQLATSSWSVKPSFALFFGDSSADSKGYTGVSKDLVPTKLVDTVYLETSSDTWLADFNNDDVEDIAIGRLPVANAAEADAVLAKLARYDAQPRRSEFKNLIVTDKFFDSYANLVQTAVPASMPTTRVDRGVLSDSAMRQAISDNLNANPFILTYYGHGSVSTWTDGSVLRVSDVANLNNNQLGLYLLMTCLNGYSHSQTGDGMAEGMFKANNGGAIAVWASSGMTIADYTIPMSQSIYTQITNPTVKNQRLGQILKAAKAASNDPDVRKTWSLTGDPTIVVK